MNATATDIATILERTKPRPPGKCHTWDHRGYPLCGLLPRRTKDAGFHTHAQCKARGHQRCVVCDEVGRQLGDEGYTLRP